MVREAARPEQSLFFSRPERHQKACVGGRVLLELPGQFQHCSHSRGVIISSVVHLIRLSRVFPRCMLIAAPKVAMFADPMFTSCRLEK